ncbi:ABC transporter substrate-binding protein [Herbiconiux sp. P17]|uniref:ABC transporter substrate-binding protein n=1 Tax=Herbiconiux wuyangfengii TaxID=3342794 RepID=UPI0035B8B172
MKKRSLLLAGAAFATAIALTACSGGGTDASSGSDNSMGWSIWVSGTEDQAAWQKVADTVATENDGLTLNIQGAPFTDYWTKLRTQLSTGSAPCIVTLQSLRAANYTDVILPLDDLVKSNDVDLSEFDQTALDGMTVDGKLYALPYDTGPVLMFYNKDMFDAAGVTEPAAGWTTDEFEAAGAALKAQGKTLFAPTVEDMYLQSLVLGYNGGRVISEDGSLDATNAKFADGLDWINSLVEQGYATQASAESTADEGAFANGQVATYIDGPWSLLNQKGVVPFNLGVVTIPRGDSPASGFAAGSGFGISKECADPDKAFAAIQTMTSEPVLESLAAAGRAFPSRTAAQASWFEAADIPGVDEVMATAQEGSVPLPGNKDSDQLNNLFAQYAIQAINGQSSGADVLQEISSQLPK